ncbi:MAG: trypsin-like serine protease [Chloroflexi bacterium]|nr:MAG: trypsin-like serine protease [Chloroflexota bacterium]
MFEANSQNELLSPSQNPLEPPLQHSPEPPREQPRQGRGGLRTGAIIGLILLLIVVFVIGGFAGWVYAGTKSSSSGSTLNATALDTQRESVAAKVKPTIVEVYVTLAKGAALGSGVIVNSQGYIVTNNHVVSGALTIQVILSNGTKEAAQLAGADAAYDLAVLKIAVPQGGLSVATLGDSTQLKVGQEVLVIGNPLGITQTVTNGIVSVLKRSVSEGQGGPTIQNAIQTDAPINPGNSGGALVDLQGHVVGIPTLTAIDPEFNTPANGVGFAIPVNRVKTILPQFIQTGSSS